MFSGRLTISQTSQDQPTESSVTLFYQAVSGETVPVIDGSGAIAHLSFLVDPSDASQSYSVADLTPGKEYDVWITENDGVAVLGLLEWQCKTYGSGLYGADRYGHKPFPAMREVPFRGIPVNSDEITLRLDGGAPLIVDAHRATFLGSIRISDDAAVVRCHTSYGEKREWGIWNAHNQKRVILKGGDTTPFDPSHFDDPGICSNVWAPWKGNYDANVRIFTGRGETVDCRYHHATYLQAFLGNDQAPVIYGAVGFGRSGGFDTSTHDHIATDIPPGYWWQRDIENLTAGNYLAEGSSQSARYVHPGSVGSVKVWGLVWTQSVLPTTRINQGLAYISMWGQENRMLLTAEWMG
jgi:hypothetical protein